MHPPLNCEGPFVRVRLRESWTERDQWLELDTSQVCYHCHRFPRLVGVFYRIWRPAPITILGIIWFDVSSDRSGHRGLSQIRHFRPIPKSGKPWARDPPRSRMALGARFKFVLKSISFTLSQTHKNRMIAWGAVVQS